MGVLRQEDGEEGQVTHNRPGDGRIGRDHVGKSADSFSKCQKGSQGTGESLRKREQTERVVMCWGRRNRNMGWTEGTKRGKGEKTMTPGLLRAEDRLHKARYRIGIEVLKGERGPRGKHLGRGKISGSRTETHWTSRHHNHLRKRGEQYNLKGRRKRKPVGRSDARGASLRRAGGTWRKKLKVPYQTMEKLTQTGPETAILNRLVTRRGKI